jgi:hypothetical protein
VTLRKIPTQGEMRTRQGFLFLPLTINKETRWLEKAAWLETYGGLPAAWLTSTSYGGIEELDA